jgi:hypothetical protein
LHRLACAKSAQSVLEPPLCAHEIGAASLHAPVAHADLDSALDDWLKLVEIVDGAPLFPLQEFADRLTAFVPFIGTHPRFQDLTAATDDALARRVGEFAAADKCRERALAFYKSGNICRGIHELHRAKISWFAHETLKGSILSMLLIAKWYLELGLVFASKYYAFAAVWASVNAEDPALKRYAAHALSLGADCDYVCGAWCSYLAMAHMTLLAEQVYSPPDDPKDTNSVINRVLFHAGWVRLTAERVAESLTQAVTMQTEPWGLEDVFAETMATARKVWPAEREEDLQIELRKQLLGAPYSDLGAIRSTSFAALGLTFRVRWSNDYETTEVAEYFLAVLQVLLSDLAGSDLLVLPTEVCIEIALSHKNHVDASSVDTQNRPVRDT